MTEIQLPLELAAAALGGGFLMAFYPRARELWDHRGHDHAFAYVWAHIHDGTQRDLRLCECGVSRWVAHRDDCVH